MMPFFNTCRTISRVQSAKVESSISETEPHVDCGRRANRGGLDDRSTSEQRHHNSIGTVQCSQCRCYAYENAGKSLAQLGLDDRNWMERAAEPHFVFPTQFRVRRRWSHGRQQCWDGRFPGIEHDDHCFLHGQHIEVQGGSLARRFTPGQGRAKISSWAGR